MTLPATCCRKIFATTPGTTPVVFPNVDLPSACAASAKYALADSPVVSVPRIRRMALASSPDGPLVSTANCVHVSAI
eukprot:scaffold18565_cov60-Phaeocystis_antarctica.AAC.1